MATINKKQQHQLIKDILETQNRLGFKSNNHRFLLLVGAALALGNKLPIDWYINILSRAEDRIFKKYEEETKERDAHTANSNLSKKI